MSRGENVYDTTTVVLLAGTLLLLAGGQILFKMASNTVDIGRPESLLSPLLIGALGVYGAATLAWILVLSRLPLSVAFPFYGLIFLLVPVLAHFLLDEPIRPQVIVGGIIILIGVAVSSYHSGSA